MGSVFRDNRCSSGGALGHLFADLELVNSLLVGNQATGTGGNPGNGGNGGAVYSDGNDQEMTVCGSVLLRNRANVAGGGLMRVSNNGGGPMLFDRTTVHGNEGVAQPVSSPRAHPPRENILFPRVAAARLWADQSHVVVA